LNTGYVLGVLTLLQLLDTDLALLFAAAVAVAVWCSVRDVLLFT